MRRIQLWLVEEDGSHQPRAIPIDEVGDTETEKRLEDLLVSAPKALLDGVTIIARQVPTAGGPLDLLGVDDSGRLVVFELKRGMLTRDAVAQVLDYASDLVGKDADDFGRLVEEYSGRGGTDKIDDFVDWYTQEYPHADNILAPAPRMVLVGLGADERATRMVNFLAGAGIDIELLTFHAFRSDGKLVLARQVETIAPAKRTVSGSQSKETNLRMLLESADENGSKDLLLEVAEFIRRRSPLYRACLKTLFAFTLQERTEEGKPTTRVYVALSVAKSRRGAVVISFRPRAEAAAPAAMASFLDTVQDARRSESSSVSVEVIVDQNTWPAISDPLGTLLDSIVEGWQQGEERADQQESEEADPAGVASAELAD